MLEASKASFWRNRYHVHADGQPLIVWDGSSWRNGGTIELAGQRYSVRGNAWGSKYTMLDQGETVIASAERVGRKNWTVQAGGQTYTFRRASIFRQEEQLLNQGVPVGSVKRGSLWRSNASADLPGLPLPVQVFVLAVVLSMWDTASAAATSGAT